MENAAFASGAGMAIAPVRVLAVDDDPVCLITLSCLLRRRGYIVTVKASPEGGLRALQANPEGFDLVMTAVRTRWPGIDGFELLRHAVHRYPVIMFSGFEPWQTVMRAIEGGASDFLTKPLRDEELHNIWQHVVRRRRINAASGAAGAVPDTPSSHVVLDAASMRGSAGLALSDEGDSGGSRNQGRATKNNFNPPSELHAAFVKATEQLRGTEGYCPRGIGDLLNVQGIELTIEQVKSHMEKYIRDCLTKHLSTMPMASSSLSNTSRNHLTPESLEIYMRSRGATNINQTSLLSNGASPVGNRVHGNEIYRASQVELLHNNANLHGNANGYGYHSGHSNCNGKYGTCYQHSNGNSNGNTNANGSHYGTGLYGSLPNGSMVSASLLSNVVAQTVQRAMPEGYGNSRGGILQNGNMATASLTSNLAHPEQQANSTTGASLPSNVTQTVQRVMREGYGNGRGEILQNGNMVTASLTSNLAEPVQQAMPTNSLFPSSMIRTMDNPNAIGQQKLPQISRLRYNGSTGGISMSPSWPVLPVDDGEELLRSYLPCDNEVMQNTASTGMTQGIHGDGAAGQISALLPQDLADLLRSWERSDGTAGTSGGSGVVTDGILECLNSADEMEKYFS